MELRTCMKPYLCDDTFTTSLDVAFFEKLALDPSEKVIGEDVVRKSRTEAKVSGAIFQISRNLFFVWQPKDRIERRAVPGPQEGGEQKRSHGMMRHCDWTRF